MKKKPQTPRKFNAEKENVQNFEEETRMSATEVNSTPSRAGKLEIFFLFCLISVLY